MQWDRGFLYGDFGANAGNFSVYFPVIGNWPESGSLWTPSTATEYFSFRICYLVAANSLHLVGNLHSSNDQRIMVTATIRHSLPNSPNATVTVPFLNDVGRQVRCLACLAKCSCKPNARKSCSPLAFGWFEESSPRSGIEVIPGFVACRPDWTILANGPRKPIGLPRADRLSKLGMTDLGVLQADVRALGLMPPACLLTNFLVARLNE